MIVRMNNRRTLTDAPILDAAYGRTFAPPGVVYAASWSFTA